MLSTLYTPDCIRTYTGRFVNVFQPTPEMICIEDIAHSLSQQCRFGGHLAQFYSVAQHSLNCASLVSSAHAKAALLHDASEAYLMDIPSPIKAKMPEYKKIEHDLMIVIAQALGFAYPLSDEVKQIDKEMLELEWQALAVGTSTPARAYFKPSTTDDVKKDFIKTFKQFENQL
jgi:5'-deoxynucleotidase YfbR-like HD superfamily hydrolase